MDSSNFGLAFGARFILDGHQNWAKEGFPVYLRVQNTDASTDEFTELGIQVNSSSVSGGGTQDLLIQPQPTVSNVSLHNIGLPDTTLLMGAKNFEISHTWVLKWMKANNYENIESTFRDPSKVLGIVYNKELYSIVDIRPDMLGGDIVSWTIGANAPQTIVAG